MPNKKARPSGALHPKPYPLLVECLERAAVYAWNSAHKHTSKPEPERVQEAFVEAALTEICEAFHIDGWED